MQDEPHCRDRRNDNGDQAAGLRQPREDPGPATAAQEANEGAQQQRQRSGERQEVDGQSFPLVARRG
jgi:hypothetical protein